MLIYDPEQLKKDSKANFGRAYRQCAVSVMDTIGDPDITFDADGVSNYFHEFQQAKQERLLTGEARAKALEALLDEIRSSGRNHQYDCIVGLSGGIDSTYLAYLSKQYGLRPLAVHFDYGWNSELAVHNIHAAVNKLGLELFTYVMDWEEFKDLLRSYFKAGVLDLDVPADHMIFGSLYKIARKYNIKYLLSGNNVMTEYTLPPSWNYDKFDWVNVRNIHRKFGARPLRKLPRLGYWDILRYNFIERIKTVHLLNYVDYIKEDVKAYLVEHLGWRDYGGKHHESIFTRFYQGYILPNRFFIDKRKAHLSTLIFAGQITKQEALAELEQPPYDLRQQSSDFTYIAKKLDFSESELEQLLLQPIHAHQEYGTDQKQRELFLKMVRFIRKTTGIKKKK